MNRLTLEQWNERRDKAERERMAGSAAVALVAYALVLVVALVLRIGSPLSLDGSEGPVKVRLGVQGRPSELAAAIGEAAAADEAAVETANTPDEGGAPEPQASEDAREGAEGESGSRTSSGAASAKPVEATDANEVATGSGGAASVKGEEKALSTGVEYGNSYELAFETGKGNAGRSFGPPIWMYMPLPPTVFDATYLKIAASGFRSAEENQAAFRAAYEFREDGLWHLALSVSIADRPAVWIILQAAGYDPRTAPYRDRASGPVVISFSVTVDDQVTRRPPRLESVSIATSCGDRELDEAVLYGFTQATFFNRMAESVSGTFTYRF
jgi:hypothetical protein